jgi:hypothetical protein
VNYHYRLYGLSLAAAESVPGLEACDPVRPEPDVCLELRSEPDWVRAARHLPSQQIHKLDAEPQTEDPAFVVTSYGGDRFFGLSYTDGTEFMVDGEGRRVWGAWTEPWTKEDFTTYLLGPVMGFVLRRRGVTPFHASCASVKGNAVILCGDAHAGKSTTAAALALRGARILCEDIAALRLAEGRYHVEPGYPRICLWPDSVQKLMGGADALPLLTPNWEKRYLPLDGVQGSFEAQHCPIRAIYVLAPRTEEESAPRIEKMTPKEALLELVQNTYMNWLLDREQRAREFDVLAHLVEQVPVRRVVPHRDASRIDALCRLLLADAERLSQQVLAVPHLNRH